MTKTLANSRYPTRKKPMGKIELPRNRRRGSYGWTRPRRHMTFLMEPRLRATWIATYGRTVRRKTIIHTTITTRLRLEFGTWYTPRNTLWNGGGLPWRNRQGTRPTPTRRGSCRAIYRRIGIAKQRPRGGWNRCTLRNRM